MAMKTKTFDCVEMKNRIQSEIMEEYEAKRGEYPSLLDFIKAKSGDCPLIEETRSRIARTKEKAAS